MAKFAVLAAGPVSYTGTDGSQVSVPTSAMFFDNGVVGFTAPAGMDSATKDGIGKLLIALAREGLLVADTSVPTAAAMVIEAKDAGVAGNNIQISITNLRPDPTDSTKKVVDATVTEGNVWTGLTPATVKAVLGTSAGTGDQRGLVFVSSAGTPAQPKDGTYVMTGNPATVDIKKADNSAGAFTLKTKDGGADAALTKIVISGAADAANPNTFTIEATWSKAATELEASEIDAAFAYEINVDPPAGGSLAPPAPGTYPLSGGANTRSSTKASASLPSGA